MKLIGTFMGFSVYLDKEGEAVPEFLVSLIKEKLSGCTDWPDVCHTSHYTRSSDASSYDEICINCGARDVSGGGWGKLREPCPGAPRKT